MLVTVVSLEERIQQGLRVQLMQMLHKLLDISVLLMLLLVELLDLSLHLRICRCRRARRSLTTIDLRELLLYFMLVDFHNEVLVARMRHITVHVELVV